MNEREWGVWLVTEEDVDDLTRRAELGGKEERQVVQLAEMTIAKLPIGCILCEKPTNGADAAKLGIVKPLGLLAGGDNCPGFVVCKECAADPDSDDDLRAKVREKFKIDARPVDAKRILQ